MAEENWFCENKALIDNLDENQRDFIKRQIIFLTEKDCENAPAYVVEYKLKVYKKYADHIAGLIDELEVYAHTLPPLYCGILSTIFRLISAADHVQKSSDTGDDSNYSISDYKGILEHEDFLSNMIYFDLAKIHVKEIERYVKKFKRYSHQSISYKNPKDQSVPPHKGIVHVSKQKLKEIKQFMRSGKKKLDAQYIYDPFEHKLDSDLQSSGNATGMRFRDLKRAYEISKACVSQCEKAYPFVVVRSLKSSFWKKFLCFLSFFLTIVAAVIILFEIGWI